MKEQGSLGWKGGRFDTAKYALLNLAGEAIDASARLVLGAADAAMSGLKNVLRRN